MWIFRHKYFADGTLRCYKARLVANDSTQLEGVDVHETFSLVVMSGTIQTVLTVSLWAHAAPERGFSPLHLILLGHSGCDSSLFIYRQGSDTAYLLQYVDDIVLTTSSHALVQRIISSLHQEFSMTSLDSLDYLLGISITRYSSGMLLSQKKYDVEILERAHIVSCNPSRTPVDTESKLGCMSSSRNIPDKLITCLERKE
ncbi:ribonuclease H-like domain-containing protein, partial [Tanacetum coccineum]